MTRAAISSIAPFFIVANAAAVLSKTTANGSPEPPNLFEWRTWGARDYIRTVGWEQPDPDLPACGP